MGTAKGSRDCRYIHEMLDFALLSLSICYQLFHLCRMLLFDIVYVTVRVHKKYASNLRKEQLMEYIRMGTTDVVCKILANYCIPQ